MTTIADLLFDVITTELHYHGLDQDKADEVLDDAVILARNWIKRYCRETVGCPVERMREGVAQKMPRM